MHLICQNLKTALKVGYICVILLIKNVTSDFGSSKEVVRPTDYLADPSVLQNVVDKFSSSPDINLNMDSENNPDYPSMDSEKKSDYENINSENDADLSNMDSEKNPDDQFIQNMDSFEKDPNDPFTQEIIRVGSDEENMIELNNLSRKKKFLWFEYGKDESGEARFRTLQGKNYNPYDFDETDNLHLNQYEDKLISKIGPKVEKIKTESELKSDAAGLQTDASSAKKLGSDQEDFQNYNSTVDQQVSSNLPINDTPAKMESATDEKPMKELTSNTDQDTKDNQTSENQLSKPSSMPELNTEMYQEEPKSHKKTGEKHRGRKKEDSLMLEFAHNRPDSRILWLDYPDYRLTDQYRLIDEDAERTLITAKDFGFVNTKKKSLKTAGTFITYIENNKIGYEVLDARITPEWNNKSPKLRAAACEYLVNDNMMLRKYELVYDSTQPPEHIQAHNITILLQIEDIQPRRIGALSCPVIQPNTSLVATLFMTPITYVNENADEYVFTFIEEDPINYPLHVRLMFLSRLASGASVEDEFVEDQRINAIDELWWYGNLKQTVNKPAPKSDKPSPKNDEPALKNDEPTLKNVK